MNPINGDIGEKRRHIEIPDEEPAEIPVTEPEPEKVPA